MNRAMRIVVESASAASLALAPAASSSADVWVLAQSRLERLAPDGTIVASVTEAFGQPVHGRASYDSEQLEVDPRDGAVWLYDHGVAPMPEPTFNRYRLLKVSPDGVPLLETEVLSAFGLAIDPARDGVWIARVMGRDDPSTLPPLDTPNELVLLDAMTAEVRATVRGFRPEVSYIAVGADGALWVQHWDGLDWSWTRLTGTVEELDGYDISASPSGPLHQRLDLGLESLSPVAVNPSDGTVWIGKQLSTPPATSDSAGQVLKLSAEGDLLSTITPDFFESVFDIAVNSEDGSIWISDYPNSERDPRFGGHIAHFSALGGELARARAWDHISGVTVDMTDQAAWAVVAFEWHPELGGSESVVKLDADGHPVFDISYDFEPVVEIAGYAPPSSAAPQIALDIASANKHNFVSPRSRGFVDVALLSSATFDALQVDVSTLRFGTAGAIAQTHWARDGNRDGAADLVARFRVMHAGIKCGDTEAGLTGETFAGLAVHGVGTIRTVGCGRPHDR